MRLNDSERRILKHLETHQSIRSKDYAAVKVSSSQRLSQLLVDLEEKHYLRGGGRIPYSLTPAARFAMQAH